MNNPKELTRFEKNVYRRWDEPAIKLGPLVEVYLSRDDVCFFLLWWCLAFEVNWIPRERSCFRTDASARRFCALYVGPIGFMALRPWYGRAIRSQRWQKDPRPVERAEPTAPSGAQGEGGTS